jgi:hypothetical protein
MTDTTNSPVGEPAENIRAHNKDLLFFALAEAGIHSVTIDYDGSGDSGQIESIEAWNAAKEKIQLPTIRKVRLSSGSRDYPYTEMNLEAAVEQLAYDYLEDKHPGWEINDGAFGTFVFNVPDRTITLEHRARFTDVDISNYEF